MTEPEKKLTALERLEALEVAQAEHLASVQVGAAESDGNYSLELTTPIKVGVEDRSVLVFRPASVADMKRCALGTDDDTDRLIGHLTGITPAEVTGLSLADWDAAQRVLAGFRMRRSVSRG